MKDANPVRDFGKSLSRLSLQRDIRRRAHIKRDAEADIEARRRNDLLPALSLEARDPNVLSMPRRNARKLDQAHVREVANSISAYGFTIPIIVDANDAILDGVVRVAAAKLLSIRSVPCIVAASLSDTEKRLLRIAANRLGEKGAWDVDELKVEFEELILEDAPIEITGFELVEIDGILTEMSPESVEKSRLSPDPKRTPVVQIGDMFELGSHRLICGDATDADVLQRVMGESVAQLVFTDEPYNVPIKGHVSGGLHREFAMASGEMTSEQFLRFNETWIRGVSNHLVAGGILATFIDWRGLHSVTTAALNAELSQLNLVVWGKTNAGMGSLYRSQHELLPLFKKEGAPHVNNVQLGRHGRWRSNLWTYPGASSIGSDSRRGLTHHPTVKPVSMLADALRDLTNRGDMVLDPFLGSGSTLVAAEKTGRVCRGVELDAAYVELIIERFEKTAGVPAVCALTGKPFSAIRAERLANQIHPTPGFRQRTRATAAA